MDCLKKRIPIGQEDFKVIIEDGYYFVDKTLLIKELLTKHSFVNLITRLRRFGKTLNMSMLKYFLENTSENPASLFEGLKICEEKELCEQHMGKYPVISLTLMNIKRSTLEDALAQLKFTITSEFLRHMDAVESYPYFRQQIDRIIKKSDANLNDYVSSLQLLSKILHHYYGKKVIILIDEYDVPLEAAYSAGYYDELLDFIRTFLQGALKSNSHLEFAVLTGCLRVAKESVFTGLNNFDTFSLTDRMMDEYFGFTPDEVLEMLEYYNVSDKQNEVKEWYDGYSIGEWKIYNPWGVIKQINEYLNGEGLPKSHWANTSGNDIVRTLIDKAEPDTKEEIEILLAGETINKKIIEDLTYHELYQDINNIWTFLFFTGYLTTEKIFLREGVRYAKLRIPNKEVHYIFENKISQWFQESAISKQSEILQTVLSRDSSGLQRSLNAILFESISYMDYSENYYHGIMTGLLARKL